MECTIGDLTVYYEEYGQGRPLLLLHGWALDHRHMVAEMEPVFANRAGWRRIYPDLPGCGRTPARTWIHGQDQILQVVLALIEQVCPRQRFAVGGISAGAYLARGVAYHRAGWLDGLLLTVPMVVPADARRDRPAAVVVAPDEALLATLEEGEARMLQGAVVQSRELLSALQDYYTPAERAANVPFLRPIRRDPARYGFSFDLDAQAEPFLAPTLILTGRQDASVGYRDAWKLLERYPRATFVVLDRAGHLLAIDQQRLFRTLVSEWLDRVEEWARLSTGTERGTTLGENTL